MNTLKPIVTAIALAALVGGCSKQPIKPWERDLLAKPAMQPVPDALEQFLDAHVYFSKEGSTGGAVTGGGGCGCN